MYASPDAVLFWLSRSVYLGLIVAAAWLDGVGEGEFALQQKISPMLLPLALVGLIAYELGVWLGLRRSCLPKATASRKAFAAVPLLLWAISAVAAVMLFEQKGIPLFTDPDARSIVGKGAGVLKRLASVWLPLSSLELFMLSRQTKSSGTFVFTWLIILLTLGVLVLITAKALILFFLILLFLVDRKHRHSSERRAKETGAPLFLGIGALIVFVTILYAKFATDYSFLMLIGFRLTTLVANMPNHILLNLSGTPTTASLLWHDGWAILSTLRVPFVSPPPVLETQLSEHVLGRYVEMGGLSPTVIGEGWILGGIAGVLLLSAGFGYLSGTLVRIARTSRTAANVALAYFAAFVVYYPMQFFAVDAFLDWGLSLIGYMMVHSVLMGAMHVLELRPSSTSRLERADSR